MDLLPNSARPKGKLHSQEEGDILKAECQELEGSHLSSWGLGTLLCPQAVTVQGLGCGEMNVFPSGQGLLGISWCTKETFNHPELAFSGNFITPYYPYMFS